MTPSDTPASPSPRRRGSASRAASSLAGDQDLAGLYSMLETIRRLESIGLEAKNQLSEVRASADPVTGTVPARVALLHLRRLRRYRQELVALLLPEPARAPRRRRRGETQSGRQGPEAPS
jgi:hypothetical protein